MVFHDHVHLHLRGVVGQPREAVGGQFLLLVKRAFARRVDADRVAAQPLRGLDPGEVVFDRLRAGGGVGIAEVAEAVAHDEHVRHALVGGPLGELGDVVGIPHLVLEELIDVFHGVDAKRLLRGAREVEVVELAGEERLVERPLGERDLEERRIRGRGGGGGRRRKPGGRAGCGEGREKSAAGLQTLRHADRPPAPIRSRAPASGIALVSEACSSGRIYRCVGRNTATGRKQTAAAAMAPAKSR